MAAPMKTLEDDDPEPWAPTCSDIDPIKENILMKKIERYIDKLESSQFYHSFRDQLQTPSVSEHFHRVLGSETKVQMVIYGIGKIELAENPRWQLSLAILMKKDFKWMGDIEVFDPCLSATESKILKGLGWHVLSLNEHGKKKALKPTIFFLPYCDFSLYNNLLQTNWRLGLLSNIALFGTRWKTSNIHSINHTPIATKFSQEFLTKNDHCCAFKDLSWQFFSPLVERELIFVNGCALDGDRIEKRSCDGAFNVNSNKVKILKETPKSRGLRNLLSDLNREKMLMEEVKRCLENFQSSEFYHNFLAKLQNSPIYRLLPKILGLESKMQIVIYGIDRLRSNAMLHLGLAILLKKDFNRIGDIEIYDPNVSAAECRVLETLGHPIISHKEHGMRQALRPTIFFMQDCSVELYNLLLKANWKTDLLSNMVVLCGNNFNERKEFVDSNKSAYQSKKVLRNLLSDSMGYILAAQTFTNEFKFKTIFDGHQTSQDSSCREDYYDAFYHSSFHFFGPITETKLQFMNEVIQEGDIVV